MWNSRDLQPPPYCEVKVSMTTAVSDKIHQSSKCVETALQNWNEEASLLSAEQYVIKRTIYKLANQFRSEKSLRGLRQVLGSLNRLDMLGVSKLLVDLQHYHKIGASGYMEERYLVSRQTVEYVLVRLQTAAALLRQTAGYAAYTFHHSQQHYQAGKMVPQNVIIMAGTARVWYVCGCLAERVCTVFSVVRKNLTVFSQTAVPWLREDLPAQLEEWLEDTVPDQTSLHGYSENIKTYLKEKEPGLSETPISSSDQPAPDVAPASHAGHAAMQDLGEVIQRRPVPAPSNDDREDSPDAEHLMMDYVTSSKLKDSGMNNTDSATTLTGQQFKLLLKSCLKSPCDVEHFKESLKLKTFQICHITCSVGKIGRKKILKKIEVVRNKVSEGDEKLLVKKLCLPVGKLLAKYGQVTPTGTGPDSLDTSRSGVTGPDTTDLDTRGVTDSRGVTGRKNKKKKTKKSGNKMRKSQ